MLRPLFMLALLAAPAAGAQKYTGPVPAKTDLPYIKHADSLIPLETAEARSEKKGDGTLLVIGGAASAVKTPMSLPIFLLKADKVAPAGLRLYKVESKDGHREVLTGGVNPPDVIHMDVTRLSADGLCRVSVSDPLESGEYVLTGEGSRVFCFQVF